MAFRILQKVTWKLFRPIFSLGLAIIRFISIQFCSLVKCGKSRPLPAVTNELLLKPAHQLAADIRSRKITSEALVGAYIARIQEVNSVLNAMIDFRFEEAIKEAKAVDQNIEKGTMTVEQMEQETPLLGVPVTIKECIGVQGLRHTVGMIIRKDRRAEKDAEVVRLMKEAGAIVIGVTNMPEMCSSMDTDNKIYGQTKNPYDTRRSPGGSSGGEASLIAAAGSIVGVGTDLLGSIRIPSMMCGVFGHKPTECSTSQDGIHPVMLGEFIRGLCVGPITRFATDLSMMLSILTDSHLIRQRLNQKVDIKKLRVFYIADQTHTFYVEPVHSDMWTAQEKVIQYLRRVHDIEAQKFSFPEISSMYFATISRGNHNYPSTFRSAIMDHQKGRLNLLWEVLKAPFFCSNHTFATLVTCIGEIYVTYFLHHFYETETKPFFQRIEARFEELLADDVVLLLPTFPAFAWHCGLNFFYESGFCHCAIANILGLPATQFPVELNTSGLPVGLQVVAGKNNDHLCLAFAEEMERAFGGWVAPSREENVNLESVVASSRVTHI